MFRCDFLLWLGDQDSWYPAHQGVAATGFGGVVARSRTNRLRFCAVAARRNCSEACRILRSSADSTRFVVLALKTAPPPCCGHAVIEGTPASPPANERAFASPRTNSLRSSSPCRWCICLFPDTTGTVFRWIDRCVADSADLAQRC